MGRHFPARPCRGHEAPQMMGLQSPQQGGHLNVCTTLLPPPHLPGPVALFSCGGVPCAVRHGAEKAQSRLQSCHRRYRLGTRPSPCRQPSLLQLLLRRLWRPNKFPQERGRAGAAVPPLAGLVCAVCGPTRQGQNFLSLQQVSNRSGHTVCMRDVRDVRVTYA